MVYEIANRLSNKGLITEVLSSDAINNSKISSSLGEDFPPLTRLSARQIRVLGTSYILYNVSDWGLIEKHLNADIIHLHFLHGFLSLYIGFLKRIKKINVPIVATSHGLTSGYSSTVIQGTAILLKELSKRIIISNASAVTTVSKSEYNYLRNYVSLKKLSFIPNGIDTCVFKPDESKRNVLREKLGFEEKDFVVLYFAHLRSAKGVSTFLKAISKIVEKENNIKFVVAGSGPLSYLVKAAEKKFESRVHALLGYVSDEEVPFLYNASDIYVLPSYVEGMPLSVMEAMASGKPVIATNVSDVPILAKHGIHGLIVPPGNAEKLAASIIKLAENPLLRKSMSEANIHKMAEYDWEKIAKRYYEVYSNVLNG